LFGEVGRDRQRVGRAEAEAPARRWVAASDLDDDAVQRRYVEFVATEAARLNAAVEAGLEELLVHRLRVIAALLRVFLKVEEHRPQRRCSRDHLLRRQPRLRDGVSLLQTFDSHCVLLQVKSLALLSPIPPPET